MSREMPTREEKGAPPRTAHPEQEGAGAVEERRKPRPCDETQPASFRFDDPYWDDAFDSYHNPTLRTCCLFYR